MTDEANNNDQSRPSADEGLPQDNVRAPFRLPGFVRREVGLGDVVKAATKSMGLSPCGRCLERAESLNRAFRITPLRKLW